ncbi:MAG: Amidase [Actinomycetia bacterium]|nr:Amidase [Actinomycetes bacterium]
MLRGDRYLQLGATDIGHLVSQGELGAADVISSALERLSGVDRWLRAFTEVWPDRARGLADEVDGSGVRTSLPLAGVPIGVKAWDGLTSFAADRLIRAGCVPLGLTSVPSGTEWQTWGRTERGPTANPWCPDRVPGGSSAGSAAAVAAGIVPMATASDGAGSTRIPAAWCGIVGIKPTNGILPTRDESGLNVPGVVARNVADVELALSLLMKDLGAAVHFRGASRNEMPSRAFWSSDLGFVDCDREVADVAYAAARKLADAGEITWSSDSLELRDPWPAWRVARGMDAPHPEATEIRSHNQRALDELFTSVDVLVTPTTPNRPHPHSGPGQTMSVGFTSVFNLSGHPCISVPAGLTTDGLPVGLQIVGAHHEEHRILRLARALEIAAPWSRPDIEGGSYLFGMA